MPVVLSYPGVYVEEIPSGQFTITGVATSITAFIGRALRGPVDGPVTLFNFGDYERMFGGLSYDFPLSYAVQDFFMNGGGQAVVARLFEPASVGRKDWDADAATALAKLKNAVKSTGGTFDAATQTKAGEAALTAQADATKKILESFQANVKGVRTEAAFTSAVDAIAAPPFPTGIATMALDTNGGGALATPAVVVTRAVLAAAFDGTGNAFNPAATVHSLQAAATQAALAFEENPALKVARSAQKAVKGDSVADAVGASLMAVGPAMAHGTGGKAPAGMHDLAQLLQIIASTVTPVLAPATAPTPHPADFATSLKTAIDGTKLHASADASAAAVNAAEVGGATVISVILATLDAVSAAVFSLPEEQILKLVAADPGVWGNNLKATIDTESISDQSVMLFAKSGLGKEDVFNLTVFYTRPNGTVDIERFTNVTIKGAAGELKPLPNRIDLMLADRSRYVRVAAAASGPILPTVAPSYATGAAAGGADGGHLRTETYVGDESAETGLYMLKKVDLFNLLCIPPDQRGSGSGTDTDSEVYQEALAYCVARRAVLIVDPPVAWADSYKQGLLDQMKPESLHLVGTQTRNAAVYFPRVVKEDLAMDGRLSVFPASGAIAGVIAATDVQRGVWQAPAGQNAGLNNIYALELALTDDEQGELNSLGINCLRHLPHLGPVVWGARTLRGAEQLSDDFKYLSVRRLALFLEESLYRGTRWAVFEPNNEALWSSLRLAINAFMGDLAKQGAFYGFEIKCDQDTNTQTNIDKGIVTVLVQYAPVKPAEFVVLQFQQQAGLSPG